MKYIISLLSIFCIFYMQNTYAGDCGSNGVNIIYIDDNTNLPTNSNHNELGGFLVL